MAGTTRNLYLQISANADGLSRVAKAARLTLADLGSASGNLRAEMEKNFRELGGSDVQQSARQIEATYRRTFKSIRAAAEETLGKPVTASTIVSGNITGAETQLANARASAAAYEELAAAQIKVAEASGASATGERELATILTGQALAAKESVAGLEQQLFSLRALRTQLGETAEVENEAASGHMKLGVAGMMADHVVRSFADSVAAGQSPMRAATMQLGRITEAMSLYAMTTGETEGKMGKFAAFMGGPWGLAIGIGVAVLSPLVEKLFEQGDALDTAVAKLKTEAEQTALNDQAHQIFSRTIEGQIDAQRRLNDQLDRSVRTQRDDQQLTLARAQAQLAINHGSLPGLDSQIAAQRSTVKSLRDQLTHPAMGSDPSAAAGIAIVAKEAEDKLTTLEAQRRDLAKSISDGQRAVREAQQPILQSNVEDTMDRKTAATHRYAEALGLLNRQLAIGAGNTGSRYLDDREHGNKAYGRTISGISADQYKQRLAQITEQRDAVLNAKDQPRHKSNSAQIIARQHQSAVRHTASTDQAYQSQVSSAQQAYARAQLDLSDTAQKRYNVELKSLQDRLAQRQAEIDDMVTAGKIPGQTKAEVQANAQVLRNLATKTEQLGQEKAKRDMLASLLDKQIAAAREQMQTKIDVLQSRQGLAIGRRAQYSDAKDLLDAQQAQQRDELAARMWNASTNPADAEAALHQYQSMPAIWANQQAALHNQYQSPLANYKDQLQSSVGDTNDALQNVGVDGLRNLEDGLTGVLTGTQNVSKAFKSMSMSIISDLARIGIEKAIIGALGGSFFGIKLADGGKVDGHANGLLPSFAGGSSRSPSGMISGPGTGRSDSILAILGGRKPIAVSNGESIVTAKATKSYWPLIKAMNDNTLPAFANGMVPQMASLSSSDVRTISRRDDRPIQISVQEGALFRPVVNGISAQHAKAAQTNATNDGALLAAEKMNWARGRKLGGTR